MLQGEFAIPVIPGVTQLSLAGNGGCAAVYRGYQERNGRWVAAKVLNAPVSDLQTRTLFLAECAGIGELGGIANAVAFFETGLLADGRPFLLMEWCGDGSLHDRVTRRGPLPALRVAQIGLAMAQALTGLHAVRRLHRDVKPANILLKADHGAVLADFGLSLRAGDGGRTLVGGTPGYAAPEQLARDEATVRSDLYGLGGSLFFALTGRSPHPAQGALSDSQYAELLLATPTPALPADTPPGLAAVIGRLLEKDPNRRPGDAGDVMLSLSAAIDDVQSPPPVRTPPEPTGVRVPGGAPSPHPSVPGPTGIRWPEAGAAAGVPAPAKVRRLLPVAIGGGIAAALLFVVGGVVALSHDEQNAPQATAPQGTAPQGAAPQGAGPGAASAAAPDVVLADPVDLGTSVQLAWAGRRGYTYAVAVAEASQPVRKELTGSATRREITVKAGVQYCFRVMATDGRQVTLSTPKGIRGAVCRFP